MKKNKIDNYKTSVKTIDDLREVLCQPKIKNKKKIVYKVWRNQKNKNGLRYDITVLSPVSLGREFSKTHGHYHQKQESELYEILKGKAIFLFQKPGKTPLKIKECYAVLAEENNCVVVPSGFGMTMINPTNKKLKVGNWVGNKVKNNYIFYRRAKGASYYCLKDKNKIKFVPNRHYQKIAPLQIVKPKPFPSRLKNLNFLKQTAKYKKLLTPACLFEKIG